jgi:hypothetical protein
VICDGQIANVEVTILPPGDTLVDGTPYRLAYPNAAPNYAPMATWYTGREPIFYQGHRYTRDGLPFRVNPADLRRDGEYQGTSLFVEKTQATQPFPDAVFVPISPGCIFRIYRSS